MSSEASFNYEKGLFYKLQWDVCIHGQDNKRILGVQACRQILFILCKRSGKGEQNKCGLGLHLEYEDVRAGGVLPEGMLPRDRELSPVWVGPAYPGEPSAVDPGLQPGDEEWLGLSHAWHPHLPTGNQG